MIRGIKARNLKCFTELDLPLSELTVLAGANATGKSTVIQALLILRASKEGVLNLPQALGVPVGNPKALISQNVKELENADFTVEAVEEEKEFKGRYLIDKLSPLNLICKTAGERLKSGIYYLNAERSGPRISYPAGGEGVIANDGSNAAYLIDRADMEGRKVSPLLSLERATGKFSVHVEQWMSAILGDVTISIETDLGKASTDIRYGNSLVDDEVLPTMTGFGISYVLPVVTAGLWCSSIHDAVLVVENPEAHLHPKAQSNIGKFLALLAYAGVQVIVETHSEHIIDGARIQMAVLKAQENMTVHFFSKKENEIQTTEIHVNEQGELSEWPKAFLIRKARI